ncbi:MAG: arylsulfatase [Planctomycetaceae bacterium]|nr:MAG: arylsulfatase [Planctomycetaceae bacterium]
MSRWQREVGVICYGLTAVLMVWCQGRADAAQRPHIVLVLCDDLGYGDLSCLNPQGKIPTPNFDRVAREGMIFTDAHAGSAVCTPTRYGLLTGRYAWRTSLQRGVLGGLSPLLVEPGRLTLASLLKQHGYRTACVGKWHLGLNWQVLSGKSISPLAIESREQVFNVDYSQPFTAGPLTVGFDEYFGISGSLDMVPYTFLRNDRVEALPTEDRSFPLMLGKQPQSRQGPTAPGFEIEHVLSTFTRYAVEFIERQVAAHQPFFLYLAYASPHTPIVPHPAWRGRSGLNYYGDFVMETDAALGAVLEALDRTGCASQTWVIVTSDNGCSPQADYPALLARGHNPSHVFRGTKADIYEGGHRVPFLVRWPGVIAPGGRSARLICLTDVLATLADVLGHPLPDEAAEDSVSFWPTLRGNEQPPRTAVVHHSIDGSFAIRQGPWKLALCPGSGGWSAPAPGRHDTSMLPAVQLFHLDQDIGEQHNLQAEHPQHVAELTQLLTEFVARGRSTPGKPQANAVAVDIFQAGQAAHRPLSKKNKSAPTR